MKETLKIKRNTEIKIKGLKSINSQNYEKVY